MVEDARPHRPTPQAAKVLIDSTGSRLVGCGAALLGAVCAGLIVAALAGATAAIIVLGLVVALGATALSAAVVEMRRWEPLELHFPTWPLTLGSTSTIEVVRRARRSVPEREFTFSADLACTEKATYTAGTDTRTESRKVHQHRSETIGTVRNNVFSGRIEVAIPVDAGAPTFDLGNNEVEWELDIDADDLSRLMAKVAFSLEVAAELDGSLRPIQDNPPSSPT